MAVVTRSDAEGCGSPPARASSPSEHSRARSGRRCRFDRSCALAMAAAPCRPGSARTSASDRTLECPGRRTDPTPKSSGSCIASSSTSRSGARSCRSGHGSAGHCRSILAGRSRNRPCGQTADCRSTLRPCPRSRTRIAKVFCSTGCRRTKAPPAFRTAARPTRLDCVAFPCSISFGRNRRKCR